ncbi:MAG TPA: AzlD domain-containing protein [Jiangellaceae bacterium]|jgi:branched-subunit amino acid transport protein
MIWAAIITASVGCYLLKLAGLSLPQSLLDRSDVQRVAGLLPVALLAALVAVGTFADEGRLIIDARVAGVAAAIIALVLRAPFLVVIVVAAATTAILRAALT